LKHCIRISIFDNGAGIPPEVVEKYNQLFLQSADENEDKIYPSSIGIQNVHKKIMLPYGQPFGLHMESVLGAYTRVDILLPLVDKTPETLES